MGGSNTGADEFVRIFSNNPYFKGCYCLLEENDVKVYYIKTKYSMKKIGCASDGISEKKKKIHNFRDANNKPAEQGCTARKRFGSDKYQGHTFSAPVAYPVMLMTI